MTIITANNSGSSNPTSEPIVIKAEPTDPRLVSFGGHTYRLTYYIDGISQTLTRKGWRDLGEKFVGQLATLQNPDQIRAIDFQIDIDRIKIWNYGLPSPEPSTVLNVNKGALRHLLINNPSTKTSEPLDHNNTKKNQKNPPEQPEPMPYRNDEYERLIAEGKIKEAVINDFQGNYGRDLTNDSLGYYLDVLKEIEIQNLEILAHRGNGHSLIYDENFLTEWAQGINNEFDTSLTTSMSRYTADNSQAQIIVAPFRTRTPRHFMLIVIDNVRKEIMGYDPLGNFQTSPHRDEILTKIQESCEDYRIVADAFTQGPHQRDGVRCGLYVAHAIHKKCQGSLAQEIFDLGFDDIDIEATREECIRRLEQ